MTEQIERPEHDGLERPVEPGDVEMTQIDASRDVGQLLDRRWRLDPERVAWLVVMVVAVVTRLWNLGNRAMSHDESLHTFYSWKLFIGEGYVHDPMMHGPLLYHFTALSYFLFGASDFTARLLGVVSGIALIASPLLVRKWIGAPGALAAGVVLLLSPSVMMYSRYIRHDIPVELFTALMFISFFRYLDDRAGRWVVLSLAAAAGAITSAEMSYINGFVLVTFIVVAILVELITPTKRWLVGTVLAALGVGLLIAAQIGAGTTMSVELIHELDLVGGLLLMWAIGAALMTGVPGRPGLVASLGKVPLDGLLAAIAVFSVIYALMFTTFFTNLDGIHGFMNSINYWLEQHDVKRGGQPWYYYLLLAPMYEYPAVMLALGAALLYTLRPGLRIARGNERPPDEPPSAAAWLYVPMAATWAFGCFWIYSWAGEKMPWLLVHMVVPMAFLGGRFFSDVVDGIDLMAVLRNGWHVIVLAMLIPLTAVAALTNYLVMGTTAPGVFQTVTVLSLVVVVALAVGIGLLARRMVRREAKVAVVAGLVFAVMVVHVRDTVRANFVNDELALEYLVYAHGTPHDKEVYELLLEMQELKGAQTPLAIGYDNEVSWPFTWYFRRTDWLRNPTYLQSEPSNVTQLGELDAVLVGAPNYGNFEPWLRDEYVEFEYQRMWWPNEGYKGLTLGRIRDTFTNPNLRRNLFNILLRRYYTANPTEDEPRPKQLDEWYHLANMKLYLKKELIQELWPMEQNRPAFLTGVDTSIEEVEHQRLELDPEVVVQEADGRSLSQPKGLAIGHDGSLWAVDHGNQRVVAYDETGAYVETLAGGELHYEDSNANLLPSAWGLGVGPNGAVYIADTWNHRVLRFEGGVRTGSFGFSAQLDADALDMSQIEHLFGPRDVAVRSDGHVFFTDTGNKRIIELDTDMEPVRAIGGAGTAPGSLDEPTSLAFDPATGELYVADLWNKRIQVFDADLEPVREWRVAGWGSLEAAHKAYLDVHSDGTVVVSDPVGGRLWFFDRDGNELGTLDLPVDPEGLREPIGVAFALDGSVWVASSANNRITRYAAPDFMEEAAEPPRTSGALGAFLETLDEEQAEAIRDALASGASAADAAAAAELTPAQTRLLMELVGDLTSTSPTATEGDGDEEGDPVDDGGEAGDEDAGDDDGDEDPGGD